MATAPPPDTVDTASVGDEVPTIPAATVVLLRDGAEGLEVLMVRRNASLAFAGGMWVFPGGRVDPADRDADGPEPGADAMSDEQAARRAAVREAQEEAALEVDPGTLVWFSHWTPPAISPRRFATWFFAARAPLGTITVDGGEILAHGWFRPADALARRNALEIELSPPTWITLEQLVGFRDVDHALRSFDSTEPEYFATRFAVVEDGAVALYHGDAGYDAEDPALTGGRHRLWMLSTGWRYERDT